MTTANRLHWIDTIKATCIICVYFAHCVVFTTNNTNLIKAVSPFYVNAFFFVSGYLLYKKYLQNNIISNFSLSSYRKALKNCIYKIIIPTIVFSSIIYIPKSVFHNQSIDYTTIMMDIFGGCSFWFTSALAVAQITILTLFLSKKRNIFFYLITTFLIFALIQIISDFTPKPARFHFPWYWRTGLIYTFIITLGGLYSTFENKVDLFLSKGGIILITISCIIIYVCVYDGYAIAFLGLSGRCSIIGFIGAISSILLLIHIIKRCNDYNITNFIGKNSIIFYFLSGAVPNTFATIFGKMLEKNTLMITTFIVSIVISYAATYTINKYFPYLTDMRLLRNKQTE